MVAAPGDLTIAIPVYNAEDYVAESIASVLAQTVKPREVMVFDNASIDGTAAVAQVLLPPGSVRIATTNVGSAANFNLAAESATSTFFAWLAADDRLLPTFAEECLAQLDRDPGASLCLPGIRYIDPSGHFVREHVDKPLASPNPRVRLRSLIRRARWTEVYAVYRREALLMSPLFSRDFAPDVLLTWWFLLRGRAALTDRPLLEYREFPTKSLAGMAESLAPGAPAQSWRKLRLWRRLWQESGRAGVPRATQRIARQELLLCLLERQAWRHLREDVFLFLQEMPASGFRSNRVIRRLAIAASAVLAGRADHPPR